MTGLCASIDPKRPTARKFASASGASEMEALAYLVPIAVALGPAPVGAEDGHTRISKATWRAMDDNAAGDSGRLNESGER